MFPSAVVAAFSLPSWISQYIVWWIAGIIVIGGLLIFGFDELRRLSWGRLWAISGVSFSESLRRKVLWVTPLAILGVIVVTQLQHSSSVGGAIPEEEAIRQTIKYCLFASGLLVTVTAIILACTNLPKEIENRVIFTIVTKPTTRLEIVLGKVIGFMRVSGMIILIMGLFTLGYLELRAYRLRADVEARLSREPADSVSHHTLEGYVKSGLLSTKSLAQAVNLQIYEKTPFDTDVHWMTGGQGFMFLVPFDLNAEQVRLLEGTQADPPTTGVFVINTMRIKRNVPTAKDLEQIRERSLPMEKGPEVIGPVLPGKEVKPVPQISIQLLDENLAPLYGAQDAQRYNGHDVPLPADPQAPTVTPIQLTAEQARRLMLHPRFFVQVTPETPSVEYEVTPMPTVLDIRSPEGEQVVKPVPASDGKPTHPQFVSRPNRYGMAVAGSPGGQGTVAVYRFRGAESPRRGDENADFQFRAGIERTGDYNVGEDYSRVQLTVVNKKTGETSPPVKFAPESNRDYYVSVPAQYMQGGDFDVLVRGLNENQYLGLTPASVQYVAADRSFVINLVKSLLILWLLSILVVIVSIFCSTFLSWPIAVVLTLTILLGHWGVQQLGDALNPGVGRSVARDLGVRGTAVTNVTSESVEALARMLRTISDVLPDVSRFPVMEDIERGISIPPARILEALAVLACYGLPMLVLSFVILKNKEVAP